MGIRAKDFRECVIQPTLRQLGLWSQEAEELLLLTAAQESQMGYYLKQASGPALGIYQIEPVTHKDVWRFLNSGGHNVLADAVARTSVDQQDIRDDELMWNLAYATAIARVKYLMVPEPIPVTLSGQAKYYKKYYNTSSGKATVDEAIKNYTNFVTNGT